MGRRRLLLGRSLKGRSMLLADSARAFTAASKFPGVVSSAYRAACASTADELFARAILCTSANPHVSVSPCYRDAVSLMYSDTRPFQGRKLIFSH